jgi:hypothetical protein
MLPASKERLRDISRLILVILVVCVGYDGRARRLFQVMTSSMALRWHPCVGCGRRGDEEELAKLLMATAEAMEKNRRRSSQWRAAKIAGATVWYMMTLSMPFYSSGVVYIHMFLFHCV